MLTIRGRGFGPHPSERANEWIVDGDEKEAKIRIDVGGRSCASPTWVSTHELTCTVPPGTGRQREVRVTIAGQRSAPTSIDYEAPEVLAAGKLSGKSSSFRTSGGETLVVRGRNFGEPSSSSKSSVSVFVSSAVCADAKIVSDQEIRCVVPKGVGADVPVTVRVDGQASKPKKVLEYSVPTIDRIEPTKAAASTEITVIGANFGAEDTGPVVVVGGHACTSSSWVSESAVLCELPVGVGKDREVTVAIAGQPSTPFKGFSYSEPIVYGVEPAEVPVAGGVALTINGANFGGPGNERILDLGGRHCDRLDFVSSERLVCKTTPKLFGRVDVTVVVGGQRGSAVGLLTTARPSVKRVSPASGPAIGGKKLRIEVDDGVPSAQTVKSRSVEVKVTVGGNPCEHLVIGGADGSRVLECTAPSGGGVDAQIVVDVAGVKSTDAVFFSYDAPIVSSLVPAYASPNGGDRVTIVGGNFGPANGITTFVAGKAVHSDPVVQVSTDAGMVDCTSVERVQDAADSRLICVVPKGSGACRNVRVTVGGQVSEDRMLLTFRDGLQDALVITPTNFFFRPTGHEHTKRLAVLGDEETANRLATALQCLSPTTEVGVAKRSDSRGGSGWPEGDFDKIVEEFGSPVVLVGEKSVRAMPSGARDRNMSTKDYVAKIMAWLEEEGAL